MRVVYNRVITITPVTKPKKTHTCVFPSVRLSVFVDDYRWLNKYVVLANQIGFFKRSICSSVHPSVCWSADCDCLCGTDAQNDYWFSGYRSGYDCSWKSVNIFVDFFWQGILFVAHKFCYCFSVFFKRAWTDVQNWIATTWMKVVYCFYWHICNLWQSRRTAYNFRLLGKMAFNFNFRVQLRRDFLGRMVFRLEKSYILMGKFAYKNSFSCT